jgi:replicative DNA helicase
VDDLRGTIDVELVFLGACMTEPRTLADTTLIPDDFETPAYGMLFATMLDRHRAGHAVSQALMAELAPQHVREIWSATDHLGELVLWEAHEQAIRERSTRRKLRAAAISIDAAARSTSDLDHVVDVARAAVDSAVAGDERRVISMLSDAPEVLAQHRESLTLLPSPWQSLNDIIGGFGPGRMVVVGARPGVGKSAIASQIAYELAQHGPVVFATMEMDKGEVYSRIVAQQAGIYYGGMQSGLSEFLAARERTWLAQNLRDVRVLDSGTQTVQSIRAAVRAAARDGVVAGVVVDYIHLLSTPQRIENETQRINELTRTLKQLAMDLHVPVIALSQLNRGGDMGMPALRDLRGSGGIEQDADCVIFLYRDEDTAEHQLMVHVAKNRQGPNFQTFPLDWQGEFVRAVDPA